LIILKEGDTLSLQDLPERFFDKRHMQKTGGKAHILSTDGVDLNSMIEEIENNMIIQALH
jgi:hypothetical protein